MRSFKAVPAPVDRTMSTTAPTAAKMVVAATAATRRRRACGGETLKLSLGRGTWSNGLASLMLDVACCAVVDADHDTVY